MIRKRIVKEYIPNLTPEEEMSIIDIVEKAAEKGKTSATIKVTGFIRAKQLMRWAVKNHFRYEVKHITVYPEYPEKEATIEILIKWTLKSIKRLNNTKDFEWLFIRTVRHYYFQV